MPTPTTPCIPSPPKSSDLRRTFLGLCLLCCLAAPALLGYGWLQYQKIQVRREVKRQFLAGMQENALLVWTFSAADAQNLLRWEHSREFEYRGQMYDVVKIEARGDSLVYHCWWDRAESNLNQQIKELVQKTLNTNPLHQKNQERLAQFYQSLYWIEWPVWAVCFPDTAPKKADWITLARGSAPLRAPISPPPETV